MEGALPLDATNLVLSGYTEEVYNLGLRVSEVVYAPILPAQNKAQQPEA